MQPKYLQKTGINSASQALIIKLPFLVERLTFYFIKAGESNNMIFNKRSIKDKKNPGGRAKIPTGEKGGGTTFLI